MKISFISQYFYPEQFSNNSIASDLIQRGHEVKATVSVPNYPMGKFFDGYSNQRKRSETWEGVEINRIWTIPRGKRAISLVGNYMSYLVFGSLRMFRKSYKPDVIFVSAVSPVTMIIPAIVQRWRTGAPVVCWVQDIWPESATFTLGIKNSILYQLLFWLSGWIYRRVDVVLIQSPAFRPMITRFGVADDKIKIFPNTAPEGFKPKARGRSNDPALISNDNDFRIMFAGNIGESQNFGTIVEAACLLRNRTGLRWIIIGDGRYLAKLKKMVEQEGLSGCFSFLGRKPEKEMPDHFAHADALLVSLKDTEIFAMTVPYKVQCYMACGRPILASLAGEGARTIETANGGLTSKPGSPEELAKNVILLMETDRKSREQMGENGRKFYLDNYASELIYDRLENWLEETVMEKTKN